MSLLLNGLNDLLWRLKYSYPRPQATLDLDFLNNRGVVAGVSGGVFDRITVARNTTATYFDTAGAQQTAAINTPRLDCDPLTGAPKGFLIEPSRSNLLLNSGTLPTQNVTVTAAAHTLSFWGTGTVTLSGTSTAGPLVGTADNTRVSLTFTPTAGTLTLTVSGTVSNAQFEAGSNPTSYIPTTATAVTRGADIATMTGTNFSDWYNQAGGTFLAQFTTDTTTELHTIYHVGKSSSDNRIVTRYESNKMTLRVINTASQCNISTLRITNTRSIQYVGVVAVVNDFRLNYGDIVFDNAGSIPELDYIQFGGAFGISPVSSISFHRLTYIPRSLSTPELIGATR